MLPEDGQDATGPADDPAAQQAEYPYYAKGDSDVLRTGGRLGDLRRVGNPTTREKLVRRRAEYAHSIELLDAAIAALDENPGAEKLLNALSRVGG